MTFSCPCCGGYIGEAAPIDDVKAAIRSPWQRSIVLALSATMGRPVRRERLISAVYAASGDKAPVTADISFYSILRNARKSIEPYGWTIVTKSGGKGNAATYTLAPMEASA